MKKIFLIAAAFLLLPAVQAQQNGPGRQPMKISSPQFENNGYIPEKYSCDGRNINPPLKIENVPPQAKSLVLIIEDPDASSGLFTHWAWRTACEPTTTTWSTKPGWTR